MEDAEGSDEGAVEEPTSATDAILREGAKVLDEARRTLAELDDALRRGGAVDGDDGADGVPAVS
jgi:hypothetical protein